MKTFCLMVALVSLKLAAWGDVAPLTVLPFEIAQAQTSFDMFPKRLNLAEKVNGPCNGNRYFYLYLRMSDEQGMFPDFVAEAGYLQAYALWDAEDFEMTEALKTVRPVIIQSQGQSAFSQLDTLDLRPRAQIDMSTVPRDLLPGR